MLKSPSEIHSCLTDERIDEIGHLIARVRAESLEDIDPKDNGWSIGCRAYAWVCSAITEHAETVSWLSVVDPKLSFISKIGKIEFSFYRGSASKPKSSILGRAQSYPDLRQGTLFPNIFLPEKLVWAYAVETDLEGNTTNIEFVGMNSAGEVVASRTVQLFDLYGDVVDVGPE